MREQLIQAWVDIVNRKMEAIRSPNKKRRDGWVALHLNHQNIERAMTILERGEAIMRWRGY